MVVVTKRGKLKAVKHTTTFALLKKERKMRLRMLRDLDASFDGINVQKLRAGESYDVPEPQAERWLDKGIAQEDKALDPPKETKAKKTTRRKPRK